MEKLKKKGPIDSAFYAIDELMYPYQKIEFNLFGDIEKVVWHEFKSKKNLKKRTYKYNKNKLEYIKWQYNNTNIKLDVINDRDGYVHKILNENNLVLMYQRDDNGYATEMKWDEYNFQKNKYNEIGQWIESKSFSQNLKKYETTKINYKNNRRSNAVIHNDLNQMIFKYEYSEFDENNNFNEIIIYDANSKPLYIVEFERTYYN